MGLGRGGWWMESINGHQKKPSEEIMALCGSLVHCDIVP